MISSCKQKNEFDFGFDEDNTQDLQFDRKPREAGNQEPMV